MNRDRTHLVETAADRRRSQRWCCDNAIQWRVARGRRLREGRVRERSLDGFVLQVAAADRAQEHAKLRLVDGDLYRRFGFSTALITRVEGLGGGDQLIFAEFEA